MNKDSIIRIYAAAVCFFAAVVGTVAGSISLYSTLELTITELLVPGELYEAHRNNSAYRHWWERSTLEIQFMPNTPPAVQPSRKPLPDDEDEVTKLREASYSSLLAARKRDAFISFLRCGILTLICVAVFWGHRRVLNRQAKE